VFDFSILGVSFWPVLALLVAVYAGLSELRDRQR